ncbi:Fe(3+) ABC transporter substrate-binding protein [Thermobrachium celere]|uniref:Ferric iron ABC transporter, iron-binding protein n=1 Tax=Thermobrachium celere DSM 8682 TaxID=941824 RepID=R7RUX3_9CLOT|nr:Fe(3+) ABC transporter substrate-binding protein [Thermobrachium celere]CDF59275.1 Ferric iron ABC transporter, iron-binding protein [Thermobrachium celere DSM 8682]
MNKKIKFLSITSALLLSTSIFAGCAKIAEEKTPTQQKEKVVNVYSDRHYDTDKKLYEEFTKMTGIKVNVVEGKSDELIERLSREGQDTQADILITADAGRLHKAKEQGLLQSFDSEIVNKNIPKNLRDKDNTWTALTVRARVIVYSKDRVNPNELSTYEALTDAKWKGRVLTRSSTNIYSQSLLASMIEINGKEKAKEWAKGLVQNFAREPQGNDRDQVKAVAAGVGDVAIVNTYYIGKMLNSQDQEEVNAANKVGVFFPNQQTTGTHINISGAGLTKASKNKENAIKLIEFLTSEEAQKLFAEANFEYPANPKVEVAKLLKSWGEFKRQDIEMSKLGEHNKHAVEIFNEVGWK